MTFIEIGNDTTINFASVCMLHNSSTDYSVSVGTKLALDASLDLHGTENYSVSNGVITLPSGSYYLLRGFVSAWYSHINSMNSAKLEYKFYDEGASSDVGRRGFLVWQEAQHLTQGDETALALIDASSTAKTISLKIAGVTLGSPSYSMKIDASSSTYTYYYYSGYSRVEIWRFNP